MMRTLNMMMAILVSAPLGACAIARDGAVPGQRMADLGFYTSPRYYNMLMDDRLIDIRRHDIHPCPINFTVHQEGDE